MSEPTNLTFATTDELIAELAARSHCLVTLRVPKHHGGDSYHVTFHGRDTEARGLIDYAYEAVCAKMAENSEYGKD